MTIMEASEPILHIGGASSVELVEKFGEPLYVYDGETIVRQVRRLRTALPLGVQIFYSVKANPNISIITLLRDIVDGFEVSSWGELYAAQYARVNPQCMIFVGPAKSDFELRQALTSKVGCLVVDSEGELNRLDEIASELRCRGPVALRVNPNLDVPGPKLRMGGAPRQFGIDEDHVGSVLELAMNLRNISIQGLHTYVGTRILDYKAVICNTAAILDFACRLSRSVGVDFEFVDIGGGLGVPYYPGEIDFDVEKCGAEMDLLIKEFRRSLPKTRVIIELGRFLVADSGTYITRVRGIKTSRQDEFALVSGGMNHLMAATAAGSLIKQHFPIVVLNKFNWVSTKEINVCGPLCTPSDVLAKHAKTPPVVDGDLIGIQKAGAYGLTASPVHFLSHATPAEVLVWRGQAHLIRRASDTSDILRNQILVSIDPTQESSIREVE